LWERVRAFGWWERAVTGALNIWRRKTYLGSGSMLECWEDEFVEWRVHAGMMREDEFL
jgi:hypothetical protein